MTDMVECIFCKIVNGEIPCHKIWENKGHLAFLDIKPNTLGMSLVIPKKHFESDAFKMPARDYNKLMNAARKVANLLNKKLGVRRTAMVMEGMGVNHAHIKLYPLHGLKEDYEEIIAPEKKFFEKYEGYITTLLGPDADSEELKKTAEKIRSRK